MVRLVELSRTKPALTGPGRVVAAADAAALIEIASHLEAAMREADGLRAAAQAEADAIREEARAAGLAKATEEIQDRLFEIVEASIGAISRTEARITDLALRIARRIIGDFEQAELTARVAMRALRLAAHSSLVRLRVAPEMVDATNARLTEIICGHLPMSLVQVVPDERIHPGGCILETDAGLIDASIESQFAAIERSLKRTIAQTGI
jgi:type III secretion protein L